MRSDVFFLVVFWVLLTHSPFTQSNNKTKQTNIFVPPLTPNEIKTQVKMEPAISRKIAYALPSFLLGLWAFTKVNEVSGPFFEPIIAACTNPDIDATDFASKTGYHTYEPKVGLGVFNVLVCLITQFVLELRETHPAGILVWGGVILVSLPVCVLACLEAGRAGVRGPVRYPVAMGLLYQLFGVSIIFPMIWVPSYIFGRGKRGGPLSTFRIFTSAVLGLPGVVLTSVVFLASSDSYLWTVSAGILGGPIVALSGLVLWKDVSLSLSPTAQNVKTTIRAVKNAYRLLMLVSFVGWVCLVAIAYQSYGTSVGDIWKDIWVDANASVAFMTIDTGVFYLALLIFVAYHSEVKAMKMLLVTPILGPGAAGCLVLRELEVETMTKYSKEHDYDLKQVERKKEA